ncbi:MAG: hypothetical protein FWC71_09120 [Defluviitaleaceae bacterium]|nr:hypothetical protein [Defluviitaleaceae bacterium]
MQAFIDFVGTHRVRALRDEASSKWWFLWRMQKQAAHKTQVVSVTNHLKFLAADGKRYYSAAVDYNDAVRLIQTLPGTQADKLRLLLAQPWRMTPVFLPSLPKWASPTATGRRSKYPCKRSQDRHFPYKRQ